MKRLLISGLSLFALSSLVLPAEAVERYQNRIDKYQQLLTPEELLSENRMEADGIYQPDYQTSLDTDFGEAFSLVNSAYQGEFEAYGIPSYYQLINAYQTDDIEAEDVVEAAVKDGNLSAMALEDEEYLEAVEAQLALISYTRQ